MDIPVVVEELGRTSQGLVTTAELTAAGVSRAALWRAVRAGAVVRVHRRVYAVASLPERPRYLVTDKGVAPEFVACVRAVLLSLGTGAAASARTAAALRGWALLVEPADIDIAMPHGSDLRRTGLRSVQRRSASRSLVRVLPGTDRLRLTSRVQTLLDCMVTLPLLEAVVVCDSALRSKAVTLEQVQRAVAQRLPGVASIAQARRVLELCDPEAGSVLESVIRVRMLLAGITGFRTQAVLRAVPCLRVDFCFDAARLVVEVDGARWHTDAARDQARDNALAVLGWRVLRFGWSQVLHEPEQVLADVWAALAAEPSPSRTTSSGDQVAA